MTGLLGLSTEILLSIISELPSASLPSLSLTNQRLHQVANPRLYESIYFCGNAKENFEGGIFEDGVCFGQKAPLEASRICDLGLLTQLLQHSLPLSSLIKRVELVWGTYEGIDEEGKVLRFLDVTKHMQFKCLVLSPPSLYFHVPACAAVTILRTRHRGHHGGSEEDVAPDIDQLHKQCCIPSLDEISIDGWLYWSESVMDAHPSNTAIAAPLQRKKTSSITKLRVSTSGAPGYVFNDILSWPQNLRVFHFECEPPSYSDQYQMPGRVSSSDFVKALQHCRDTLEELSIRCSAGTGNDAPDFSTPINLCAFPCLKRLCIRHDFLLMDRYTHNDPHYDGLVPRIFEVLPSSLEELHLEIGCDEFQMYEFGPGKPVSKDVYWFLDTLEELAKRKPEYLPRLTRVVSGESPTFHGKCRFWDIMNSCDRGAEVKAAFARENIRFSCWVSKQESRIF